MERQKRGQWQSNFGFIMAAVGSAVGLGNIWGFPYKMGKSGGFAFLLIYLVFVVTIGYIVMLSEFAIGRHGKLDAIGSYSKIKKGWGFNGLLGVLAAVIILSFYSVLGGWVTKYAITYFLDLFGAGFGGADGAEFFVSFISAPVEPVIWHLIFMIVTVAIIMFGVEKGIEKYTKIMMPALFVMLVIVIIRSVTLPGAAEGLKFMFAPDFSVFTSWTSFTKVASTALAQMFFSLSLGMGAMVTYGSYLSDTENIEKNAMIVPALDTMVALMAGLAIMPAVFAFNLDPSSGPGLMFITLYEVFNEMPMGTLFGIIFYVLVFFAALTSAISLLEVAAASCIDRLGWSRKSASLFMGAVIFLVGIPSALSQGVMSGVRPIMGMDFIDSMDFIGEYTIMPLGAMLTCIFITWVWGRAKATEHISNRGALPFKTEGYFFFMLKYVTPVLVVVLFYTTCIQPIIGFLSK